MRLFSVFNYIGDGYVGLYTTSLSESEFSDEEVKSVLCDVCDLFDCDTVKSNYEANYLLDISCLMTVETKNIII